jgi:hypothetical protein
MSTSLPPYITQVIFIHLIWVLQQLQFNLLRSIKKFWTLQLCTLNKQHTDIHLHITNTIHTTIIIVTQFRRPVAVFQRGCAKNENRSSRTGTPVTFKVHLIRQAFHFSLYNINNDNWDKWKTFCNSQSAMTYIYAKNIYGVTVFKKGMLTSEEL